MRGYLTTVAGVGDISPTSELTGIWQCSPALMQGSAFLAASCYVLKSYRLSGLWWGQDFPSPIMGRGYPLGRHRHGNNALRRNMNFHVRLLGWAVSLTTLLSPLPGYRLPLGLWPLPNWEQCVRAGEEFVWNHLDGFFDIFACLMENSSFLQRVFESHCVVLCCGLTLKGTSLLKRRLPIVYSCILVRGFSLWRLEDTTVIWLLKFLQCSWLVQDVKNTLHYWFH